MIAESYSLVPNLQKVVLQAYDQYGTPVASPGFDIYSNTANNLFQAYLAVRDRDLKPIVQSDLDAFKAEAKSASAETAARSYIKQCLERSHNESILFDRIFSIDPQYSVDPKSAFASIKTYQRGLVTGVNISPIATNLQSILQSADLQTICNVLGWITNEYLLLDYDDDETPFTTHCRAVAARLLSEHLWTFTDATFEAEIAKSITKAPVSPESLKIGPVSSGVASSNASPPVKKALELLVLFDRAMPKERCVSVSNLTILSPFPLFWSSELTCLLYSSSGTVQLSTKSSRSLSQHSAAPSPVSRRPRTVRIRICS